MSIEDLPNGGKRVRWRENGRSRQKDFPRGKAREAKAFEQAQGTQVVTGTWTNPTDVKKPLSYFATPYLESLTDTPQTREDKRGCYRRYIEAAPPGSKNKALSTLPIISIDHNMMKDWANKWMATGLTSDTVGKAAGVVAQIIDSAYETLHITDKHNPARKLGLATPVRKEKTFLKKDQIEALAVEIAKPRYLNLTPTTTGQEITDLLKQGDFSQYAIAKKLGVSTSTVNYYAAKLRTEAPAWLNVRSRPYPEMGTLVRFAAYTGLRIDEIAALRPRDLDFEAEVVIVQASIVLLTQKMMEEMGSKTRFYRKVTKTDEIRRAPLVPSLIPELKALAASRKSKYDDLFQMPSGGTLDHNNILADWLKPAAAAIGVPELRFHDLRHTFMNLGAKKRIPPKTMQAWAGHKRKSTTDLYYHEDPEDQAESRRLLDE